MQQTKRFISLGAIMAGVLGALMFVIPVTAGAESNLMFSDDFSQGLTKWQVVWDPGKTVRIQDGYLVMGANPGQAEIRIPGIISNSFDLTLDVDLSTGAPDWLGIRFGTAEEGDIWSYGHLLMLRPDGRIELFTQSSAPGTAKDAEKDHYFLGKVSPFETTESITVEVRPDRVTVWVRGVAFEYTGLKVDPGYIGLYAMNSGPIKLSYVEVASAE